MHSTPLFLSRQLFYSVLTIIIYPVVLVSMSAPSVLVGYELTSIGLLSQRVAVRRIMPTNSLSVDAVYTYLDSFFTHSPLKCVVMTSSVNDIVFCTLDCHEELKQWL
jgi:hypothetical protein